MWWHRWNKRLKTFAICALKIHVSEKVQEDKLNIITYSERRTIEDQNEDGKHKPFVKDNYPTLIVHGMLPVESYLQTDHYTCGPIPINHFAKSA